MKLEIAATMPAPMTVEEFSELATRTYDPSRPETVWELRYALLAVAQDQNAIWQLILECLTKRLSEALPAEQASYYIIHDRPTFSLRATIWIPERQASQIGQLENGVFAYDYPHNHNFDLLTVNCFGHGYQTDLYSIDKLTSDTRVGDIVNCRPLGRTHLTHGAMLLYEAFTDVHTQVPVDDISVALNFLPRTPLHRGAPQHGFEVIATDKLRVSGAPLSEEARELWALRLLGKLHFSGHKVAESIALIADSRAESPVGKLASYILTDRSEEEFQSVLLQALSGGASVNYRATAETVRERRLHGAGASVFEGRRQ